MSSNGSSCSDAEYSTISLGRKAFRNVNLLSLECSRVHLELLLRDRPQSSSSRGDREAAGSSSGNPRPRAGVGSTTEDARKRSIEKFRRKAKKQKLAEEVLAKRAANVLNKICKPAECMKYINLEIHPTLSEAWYMADLNREVTAAGARLHTEPELIHPALVSWSRTVPQTLVASTGQMRLTPSKQRCGLTVYLCGAEELADYVISHTLSERVSDMIELAKTSLTLVIFGSKDYFKSIARNAGRKKWKKMTENDLEMAITDVLVTTGCDSVRVDTANELSMLLVQFTKAIAETPYKKNKRECDDQAAFYMRGESKNCIAVDRDGAGLNRLWQQMLAMLPLSSLETARALMAKYKTPLALYEALHKPEGVGELAEVGVARTAVPGSKQRRIGPEFARKLNTLFTAEDGNVLLG